LGGTVLASDNVGACSWADGLLDRLAVTDGECGLPHVGVDVGENVDATILVDVVDSVDLGAALHGHVLEPVNNKLESTVGKGGVGCLDVVVVWHELIENSLLGELINLSRVGNLSLVLEGLLVREAVANVQEVGDDAGVAHPTVNGGLHQLGLSLGYLTLLVGIITAILNCGVAHIAALAAVVVVVIVVVVSVVSVVALGVVSTVVVAVAIITIVAVLWESDGKSREKESDGGCGELHFERLVWNDGVRKNVENQSLDLQESASAEKVERNEDLFG
jgi:hypothetical protein